MTAIPPTPADNTSSMEAEIAQLRRTAARERQARLQAEAIAEKSLRELFEEQQRLQLLQKCTVAANEAHNVPEALSRALHLVCEFTGWPVGHALLRAEDSSGDLVSARTWHLRNEESYRAFRTVTEAIRFAPGLGLPGTVAVERKAVFSFDLTQQPNFPRRHAAATVGLNSAFAFPIFCGPEVAGVFEFFAETQTEVDPGLLRGLDELGMQLGRAIERAKAERQLRETRDETEALISSLSAVLIGLDADGRVTRWNSAAENCFCISEKKALGSPFLELPIHWDWSQVQKAVTRCAGRRVPVVLDDFSYRGTDGTERWLHLVANPSWEGVCHRLDTVLVCVDITHRRMLEGKLQQAQKLEAIGQLAAGVAHEINSPIQFISVNLRFLEKGVADLSAAVTHLLPHAPDSPDLDPEEIRYLADELPAAIQQSIDGAEKVATIIRAMKHQSHPGGEHLPSDLNQLVQNALTLSTNEWKYVADPELHLSADLPSVSCDPGEIGQAILNLIVNAAHAIGDVPAVRDGQRGTITLRTSKVGDRAVISVGDTGTGIPEEIRDRIFDPFFTTKEVGKGTGQGLFLVHSTVVEKHRGAIRVDSTVGKGTTVHLELSIQ